MKKIIFLSLSVIFLTILQACNTQVKEKEKESSTKTSTKTENRDSIPDSVIQFLINSAAKDFHEHQPPTVVDIRNVKAGYISSGTGRTYLLCGEFLSQEKSDWDSFTTIKTSGYEQYLGRSTYCQDATFAENESNRLSEQIKNKLTELNSN